MDRLLTLHMKQDFFVWTIVHVGVVYNFQVSTCFMDGHRVIFHQPKIKKTFRKGDFFNSMRHFDYHKWRILLVVFLIHFLVFQKTLLSFALIFINKNSFSCHQYIKVSEPCLQKSSCNASMVVLLMQLQLWFF